MGTINEKSTITTNDSQMIKLDYSIERNRNKYTKEVVEVTNTRAFERFKKLCMAQYYFRLNPYTHQQTGAAYFWVFAVKAKSATFDFKLSVNDDILNTVMGYISTGTLIDTSTINPDNLDEFNQRVLNFALELHRGEILNGQTKVRNLSDVSYSKYDYGMITYKTRENEELRDFIDSTI